MPVLEKDFDFQGSIPHWSVDASGMAIHRDFVFQNFQEAFAFMTLCAQYAEEINHHPDWSNCWNTVKVRLSTHSAKALTELDIQLAKAMDTFANQVNTRV